MSLIFRKILVPTDFSETADTALYYGKELALQFGAELHLLHVCEDPMLLSGWPLLEPRSGPDVGEEAAALRERLTNLIGTERRQELRAEVHVIVAAPTGLAISRYAKEGEFELIVMGTHGRGPVSHAIMGSVAEKVVRTAPCPVLTIRRRTSAHPNAAVDRMPEATMIATIP
jgi:nucleotide-binding universal stress UspA family protein